MQKFYFDNGGWLSTQPIEGRETTVAPPDAPLPQGCAWNFTGYEWQAHELNPAHHVLPALPASPRHISVGALFDRFGAEKWAILADTAPMVQALVRDCSARRYIDLDRPDLVQALQLLVQAGHAVDAETILGGAIRLEELP